jgi:hypothetical protein
MKCRPAGDTGDSGRGFEGGIVGAVDLDWGQCPAGELQLALLRQALGIEDPAPRLEGPAADADVDGTCHGRAFREFGCLHAPGAGDGQRLGQEAATAAAMTAGFMMLSPAR